MSSNLTAKDESAKRRKAVAYVRVSSKEQEREGYSIPAQIKLLRKYAAANSLELVRVFQETETAKKVGRRRFNEMLAFLRDPLNDCTTILVEKTDRLYRHPKDWVVLDEMEPEIHLVKENEVISVEAHSSTKFVHGIKVLVAKHSIDNLSEESSVVLQ
ncbi:MAG: recombinase family protein [Candidatus Zixiibacteriota bacterium]